ncbi:MAG TPA: hypothetical protein VFJ82_06700 [Longimicrobium sp.]|nr:hypothetical protein [Longimicrobium sp.]
MTVRRAVPLLALLSACAAARPVELREFRARRMGDPRMLAGLQMLYTLQMTYQAQNGRFAGEVDQLRSVGFTEQDFGGFRPVITDAGSRLCVAMLPADGSRRSWSIGGDARLWRGPRCGR